MSSPHEPVYLDPARPLYRCTECGLDRNLCSCPSPSEKAHRRLHSPEGVFLRLVWDELTKMQERNDPNLHLLSRLSASVGDVNTKFVAHDQASREEGTVEPASSAEEIYRALIRTAVLTLRLATEGDVNYAYDPPRIE